MLLQYHLVQVGPATNVTDWPLPHVRLYMIIISLAACDTLSTSGTLPVLHVSAFKVPL